MNASEFLIVTKLDKDCKNNEKCAVSLIYHQKICNIHCIIGPIGSINCT
jgi:hypothetical protein